MIDCREFIPSRYTGIGRVLEGLIGALSESYYIHQIILAITSFDSHLESLIKNDKIQFTRIPSFFLCSELSMSRLSHGDTALFISPYPKLPLFGCRCKTVHIIHDVLNLTFPPYKKRFKSSFNAWRLKKALKKADLTWYDSFWSLDESKKLVGWAGHNPKVRYPGIDDRFNTKRFNNQDETLARYHLQPGYILVLGNGLPHKNLGILLDIANILTREIVFAGVSATKQVYWKRKYPFAKSRWIEHINENDLPLIIKNAFCLAQPSVIEGYGYPPLEAMACGVPAIVSDIPVLLETTGRNAINANPHDSKEWLNQFKRLEDKTFYQVQKLKGLEWIEPLRGINGWKNHVKDIEALLKGD
jgi:glycosyltransferase involved in cell wall biosynthesis